jgi:hypothetical protein
LADRFWAGQHCRLIPEAPAVERVVVLRRQFAFEFDLELDGQ